MIRVGHFSGCPKAGPCTCPRVMSRAPRRPVPAEFVVAWHVRAARQSAGLGLTGRLRVAAARRLAG